MNIHSRFASLGGGGGSGGGTRTTPVGGHRIIGGLIPCNAIPDEILSDHPDRFRAAIRDPEWRRKNPGTSLRVSPVDAAELGIADGGRLRLTTKRGTVEVTVELSDTLLPGHVTLPNGQGLAYPDADQSTDLGVAANELTASEDRDWFAGTPWHKHVRARLEPIA